LNLFHVDEDYWGRAELLPLSLTLTFKIGAAGAMPNVASSVAMPAARQHSISTDLQQEKWKHFDHLGAL